MVAPAKPNKVVISPAAFARLRLGMSPYGWQDEVMADVASGVPTTVRTPNGSGKTSVIVTTLALWCLEEFPRSTVVLTSATFRAVKDQIFASLQTHEGKFRDWKWNDSTIETPEGGQIIGFATDRGGRFEGFHAYPGRPLLIVLDEAKSLADEIFVAADRCQPTMLLYISSPGGVVGRFKESFGSPRFRKHAIGLAQCPHISREFIEAMKEQYGEDSAIYRSMMMGEFASGEKDGHVVPWLAWDMSAQSEIVRRSGRRIVFCDFANGGGDENVIARRDGNVVVIEDAWAHEADAGRNTMRLFRTLKRLQDDGYELYGDKDGCGAGYIVALGQMGVRVQGVGNNDPAQDAHYFNLAAEMWWTLAAKLGRGEMVLPWKDDVLKKQMLGREEVYRQVDGVKVYGREDGKLQLMPKSKLNTKSPDRADAVVGAAYDYLEAKPVQAMGWRDESRGRVECMQEERSGAGVPGAFCD